MKIGVFGDSFADKNVPDVIWWRYLQTLHGHEVESFGEGGSSIVFSAKKILEKHKDYEFVIWCVTSADRATVWHRANYKEISVHVTGRHHVMHSDPEMQLKIDATQQYLLHAWDGPDNEFQSRCVIEHVKSLVPNMLLIPCFAGPLFNADNVGFNLFELCQRETDFYFNNQELGDIYDRYLDSRPGHFTDSTHRVLADLISHSLISGTFSADYEDFPAPTEPFDGIFRKK